MERLTQRDFRSVLDFLLRSYALSDFSSLSSHVVSALPRVVPSEITTWNEVHHRQNRVMMVTDPPGSLDFPDSLLIFERHMHEHPLILRHQRTRDGRAYKISDFLTRHKFRRLGLYNEYYRRVGVERQIAFALPTLPALTLGIALNRERRDFSERERLLLNLLRPHLIQVYRNSEAVTLLRAELAALSRATDVSGRGVVVLTGKLRVSLMTARARELVSGYFGSLRGDQDRLPEVLQRWVRHQQQLFTVISSDVPGVREPLVMEGNKGQLVVRFFSDGPLPFLLLDERETKLRPAALEPLGLSRREAEVLVWVAGGKSNEEVATILGVSLTTIKKHLERIYIKLGVENRTAATIRALDVARP